MDYVWCLAEAEGVLHPTLVRPLTKENRKEDGPPLAKRLGLKDTNGRSLSKNASSAAFFAAFSAKLLADPDLRAFYDVPEDAPVDWSVSEIWVGYACDVLEPCDYERAALFLARMEEDQVRTMLVGASPAFPPASVAVVKRAFEEETQIRTEFHASVPMQQRTLEAGRLSEVEPAARPPPDQHPAVPVEQPVTMSGLAVLLKTTIQDELCPLKKDMEQLRSRTRALEQEIGRLRAQEAITGKVRSTREVAPVSPRRSVMASPQQSPGLASDDSWACSIQKRLNKISNPAARDLRLVQRSLNSDRRLKLDELRAAEINKEDLQLAIGDGHSLTLRNSSSKKFNGVVGAVVSGTAAGLSIERYRVRIRPQRAPFGKESQR